MPFKVDHHIHTSRHSPDSGMSPEKLVESARKRGLDAIVITEHDYLWTEEERAELEGRSKGLVVLSGVEVSAVEGHFLVYGLTNPFAAPPGIKFRSLLKVARDQGAAIVAAHPFRWGQAFDKVVDEAGGGSMLHGVEVVSKNHDQRTRSKTLQLAERHPQWARTGSSDSHEPETVGCYYSELDRPVATIAEFVAAIKDRAIRPRHSVDGPHACGKVDD